MKSPGSGQPVHWLNCRALTSRPGGRTGAPQGHAEPQADTASKFQHVILSILSKNGGEMGRCHRRVGGNQPEGKKGHREGSMGLTA